MQYKRRCFCPRQFLKLGKYFVTLIVLFSIFILSTYTTFRIARKIIEDSIPTNLPLNSAQLYLLSLYEEFTRSNQSLCNEKTYQRGLHQKIIALSIYGTASRFTDNKMFAWNTSIIPFLKPLVDEVQQLLPSWIIRIYTDFVGSTQAQRELLYNFSNVDVCDLNNLPIFGSSILSYLPGKMWRFLPIFDPYVDYILSRDLDSPITKRETETLELWLSDEYANKAFYIARDHPQHTVRVLGGLWGAATVRARQHLQAAFRPMLDPDIAARYKGTGDQAFVSHLVWNKVRRQSLIFDSFFCQTMGGRPFLSQRMNTHCFLGCMRPCCTNATLDTSPTYIKPCPLACRPKDHQDWEYC